MSTDQHKPQNNSREIAADRNNSAEKADENPNFDLASTPNSGEEALKWHAIHSHGALRVSGPDATDFLHAQLASDIAALEPLTGQWSAWLTAKGRVISVLLVIRIADDNYIVVHPKSLEEALVKRLKMYVLRSKVAIEPLPRSHRFAVDAAAGALLSNAGIDPWHGCLDADGLLINLSQGADIAAAYRIDEALTDVPTSITDDPDGADCWDAWITRCAQPWVEWQTTDRFIPQSLNLDALGGLSYDKGCYPGQEIVARTHFKGRLKYRAATLTLSSDEDIARGSSLRLVDEPNRSAVALTPGSRQLLAVVPIGWLVDEFKGGEFVAVPAGSTGETGKDSVDGREIYGRVVAVTTPPYPLPEN